MEDKLTQLYDREAFFKVLAQQIMSVHDHNIKLALLVIDIDRFQRINTLYDYPVGDKVLKFFAKLLTKVKRKQDYLARIGDNRFALILANIMNVGHATLAAQKILRLLEPPFEIDGIKLSIEATIGIALCPLHASQSTSLLQECEKNILTARLEKVPYIISHNDGSIDSLSDNWDIELDLEEALQTQQFEIYYQPKICLKTFKPTGGEALLRWNHRKKGFISPAVFIPIAEKSGHMKAITSWIINSALRHSANWTKKWGPLAVSVNIPPDLIFQLDLKDGVENAINLWGKSRITLVLEIIERSLVEHNQKNFQILKALQDMGIKISVDDFGTGYSSLAYFKHLPIDELKIDQSFVFELIKDRSNAQLVQLMIDLANNFNLETVAEGIEDKATLNALKSMGCNSGQGYFIAKPMPYKDFEVWLDKYQIQT